MLTGIHFLLTYVCTYECDHCFLCCSPNSKGTFTLEQIRRVYDEIALIPTIEWIYFEGGEPFLYYPLLLESLRLARSRNLKTGIVTNCYWATAGEDAELWLGPVSSINVDDLSVSDDEFHCGEDTYIDACHFCYLVRLSLIDRFPHYLAPRQVYGLE